MTIKSKFPGKCGVCNGPIAIGDEIEWSRGAKAKHATVNQCAAAKKAMAAKIANNPVIDLKPIADFLTATIQRGLKSPKLRVLHTDGKSELRLSITKGGIAPGSIAVTVGGTFTGCIRPDGQTTGGVAASEDLQKHLLRVAQDPVTAAKEYAALMGLCSFCHKPLTEEGSVEVGYGPVCAKHWGLPHKYIGTKNLGNVPQEV